MQLALLLKSRFVAVVLLPGLLLGARVVRAQQDTALPEPITRHYDAGFQPVAGPDSTGYCAEVSYRDSVTGVTRVYYASGQLKQYSPFVYRPQYVLHGTQTTWYENGQLQSKEDFLGGQRHGDLLTYYPDGTLKRREQYTRGRGGVGTCYAPSGAVVPFFAYEQLPLYPGGQEELQKELTKGIRLTPAEREALRHESVQLHRNAMWGSQRSVFVELVVAEDGRVATAEVVQSTASFLNSAALRSAASLKRQFVPARRDGELVKSRYTVPVYYQLTPPYRVQAPSGALRPMRR